MRPSLKLTIAIFALSTLFFSCQKETNDPALPPTVDAGNSQTIQLPTTTFTLTGTATSTNGGIKTYHWTLISGPNLPIIATPGASSTVVAGFIKGTYLFQLVATDKAGLSGSDTASVVVKNDYIVFTLNPPVVDAGISQTIQMPASSFTLSGTATSSNGSIRAYLWSLVSGPNVPTINSPGLRTTTVSNFIPGNYLFQFMAIDSAGLTGVDTVSVIVLPAPIQTVTLFLANDDAVWLNFAGNASTNNSAHDIDLDAAAWTIGGNPLTIRGAFKFDLSGIPTNATILSAKLSLYSNPTPINGDQINANSGTNNSFYIRRITNTWNGTTATWATQPSTSTSDQVQIAHTSQSFLDLIDVDVKTMVGNMVSGGNNGFMLVLQDETPYNIRQFCSSKHPNSSKKPKLVVTYQ